MGLGSLEPMAHGAIRPRAPCATTPVLTEADGKIALTQPALVDTKSLDSKTEVYRCRIFVPGDVSYQSLPKFPRTHLWPNRLLWSV